jgi:hypothetical protein
LGIIGEEGFQMQIPDLPRVGFEGDPGFQLGEWFEIRIPDLFRCRSCHVVSFSSAVDAHVSAFGAKTFNRFIRPRIDSGSRLLCNGIRSGGGVLFRLNHKKCLPASLFKKGV